MEPQLFAVVDAEDHGIVYSLGVDTGEGTFTFRRDPDGYGMLFGQTRSMYTAFTLANRTLKGYGGLALLAYYSTVDEVYPYEEGVCLVCKNRRKLSDGMHALLPPERATQVERSMPCPECLDEQGNLREPVR